MQILKMGDEVLRRNCLPIEQIDENLRALVLEMFVTLQKSNGIGLAAPQVGYNLRLFIVKLDDMEGMTFINPQIIQTSEAVCTMEEGCLSIPKIYEKVVRPKELTLQYMDINGKKQLLTAGGLLARVIQHENDHLNGVLFLDRLNDEKKEKAIAKFEKIMRKARM